MITQEETVRPRIDLAETRFVDVLTAEYGKATKGLTWLWCLMAGILLSTLSVAGLMMQAEDLLSTGMTMTQLTQQAVEPWFMVLLFSGVFGGLLVTREYAGGPILRSVILTTSRSRLFAARFVVSVTAGVAYGLVAVVGALVTTQVMGPAIGHDAQWSHDSTGTLIGVFAVVVATAPWGTALGWLVRRSVIVVLVLLTEAFLVDETLFKLVPSVGKFLYINTLSAVYGDNKPELLSTWAGVGCMVAWIAVATIAAFIVLRHRDLT
jgi:ABC-type transport system involved in multi-copper enzyme maturation permease subunit